MLRNFLRLQSRLARPVSARLASPLPGRIPKFTPPLATRSSQTMSNPVLDEILELQEQKHAAAAAGETNTRTRSSRFDVAAETEHGTGTLTNMVSESSAESPAKREPTVPSRSIFVSNIPYSVEEAELREIFAPYGTITTIRIASTVGGRRIGYAHVEFAAREQALDVYQSGAEEPFVLFNRQLRVEMANKTTTAPRQRSPGEPSATIHIANNPRPGDERAIREVFKQFEDKIVRVSFMKDVDGNYTSKTFIQFANVEAASHALAVMQRALFDETYLNIYYARDSRTRRGGPPQ